MPAPAKSLHALLLPPGPPPGLGTWRADRHWHLVVGSGRPEGVSEDSWREVLARTREFLDRSRESAAALDALSPEEEAAYRKHVPGAPETRSVSTKRLNLKVYAPDEVVEELYRWPPGLA